MCDAISRDALKLDEKSDDFHSWKILGRFYRTSVTTRVVLTFNADYQTFICFQQKDRNPETQNVSMKAFVNDFVLFKGTAHLDPLLGVGFGA